MTVADIAITIEYFAPLCYQESYDNSGLQVGSPSAEVTAALVSLDVTEAVVDEAISNNANLIIAHHPLLFSGIKSITGRNQMEKILIKAIRNNINIYCAHTNLDNVKSGVNARIAQKLGLTETSILSPKADILKKLQTYVPLSCADQVKNAIFEAGAGSLGEYEECSFTTHGEGSFRPMAGAKPNIGIAGGPRETVQELKIEALVPLHLEKKVISALLAAHPYEEVAYELIPLSIKNKDVGAGLVGTLQLPVSETSFLQLLKEKMSTACIRHTALRGTPVQRVAVCGGSGSFLLRDAVAAKADIFVTADYKYHQFFEAEGKILIADIGHFESEQYTGEIFKEILREKFPNFAVLLSNTLTNPVNYFC